MSGVYASTNYVHRRQLWAYLVQVYMTQIPWVVIGDFNVVMVEKSGGNLPTRLSCEEFKTFSNMCDLIHMDSIEADLHGQIEDMEEGPLISGWIEYSIMLLGIRFGLRLVEEL